MVSSLLKTYATDDVIAKTHAAVTRYIQTSTKEPLQYADVLMTKSLRCREVNEG